MPLQVITIPAPLNDKINLGLLFLLKTSNDHIEIMADTLRNSDVNDLDPKDGRTAIITLSVNSETASIEFTRDYLFQ